MKNKGADNPQTAEDAAQEKELLLAALNVLEDGIQVVDKEGRTVLYTEACEKIEQSKSEYVLGKHISEAYPMDDESSILLKVLKTGVSVRNHHMTYITPQGKTADIITNTYPILKNSTVVAAVSVNRNITKVKELAEKVLQLQKDLYSRKRKFNQNGTQFCFGDIIESSTAMKKAIEAAKKVAINLSPVLIQGETGTGKELFAQSIHNLSPRYNGPFVAINCGAIPETLLESILFGTSKGAFTGAEEKPGLFEEAHEGTLFLDEINSMSVLLQTKLLRVLQSKTVRRVGGGRDILVNPRIISAINVDPHEANAKGQFRNDLYYRLAVVTLMVPPLRERSEDIPALVKYFIEQNNKIMGKAVQGVSKDVMKVFMKYNWPGNVRELEHTIEHAMNMAGGADELLSPHHLPPHIREKFNNRHHFYKDYKVQDLRKTLLEIEKDIIYQELTKNDNNITKTSRELGVSRQYLQYRMKRLHIRVS